MTRIIKLTMDPRINQGAFGRNAEFPRNYSNECFMSCPPKSISRAYLSILKDEGWLGLEQIPEDALCD